MNTQPSVDTAGRPAAKAQTKYAFIGYRPSKEMNARIRKLAKRRNQSVSSLLEECLNRGLPALEQTKP